MTSTFTRNPRTLIEQRRNRCTNPRVGAAIDGYSAIFTASGTISRNTGVGAPVASTAATCTLTGVPASYWGVRFDTVTVTAGNTYTVSAYMLPSGAGRSTQIVLTYLDAADASVGQSNGPASAHAQSTWERRSHTAVAPAGAVKLAIQFRVTTAGAIGEYVRATGVLAEASAVLGDYFAGHTADAPPIIYDWLSTADASMSTQSLQNPADVTTPDIVNGYEASSPTRTTTHDVANSEQVIVAVAPAGAQRGVIRLVYDDVMQAMAAFALFKTGNLFDFADTELPDVNMTIAPSGGDLDIRQDGERVAWIVTVPFVEVV